MNMQPLLVRIRGVGARQQTSWFLWLFLVAVAPGGSAQDAGSVPEVDAIVARMAQARAENRARFRPYTITRDYKLFGKESPLPKSQVTAGIAFAPPNTMKYAIEQTSGTGWGEKIVRRILASEAKKANEYASTDISQENYGFRLLREEVEVETGHRCYVLELLPKRKDKHLIRGNIWVDANTYLLHRVEGELAKSLSWWVRGVHLVVHYSDVGGMWLQTASEATANVRVVGPHTLVSRNVRYEIGELVATGASARVGFSGEERPAMEKH